jgi:probable addiction module antidote protein
MTKPMTYSVLRTEVLSDFDTALHYLQHALKDNDLAHFMAAFARVVEAQGGVGKFAKKTHLSRQSIYNAIKNKSLRADSFFEVVRALGLRLDLVVPDGPGKGRHRIARRTRVLQAA